MGMVAIKKVKLREHHQNPGRTKHTLSDSNGTRPFPPFTSLVIARYEGDSGYYLLHVCDDGWETIHHETLEEAFHQAEWALGVHPEEWDEV